MTTQNSQTSATPVLDLLSDPNKWTKGAWAKDENGESTSTEEGVCFCLAGAIIKCYGDNNELYFIALNKVNEILRARGHLNGVIVFNDTHTYEEVLDLVREAQI